MKLGVDKTTGMKSNLQTHALPFVIDKEIIVKLPDNHGIVVDAYHL